MTESCSFSAYTSPFVGKIFWYKQFIAEGANTFSIWYLKYILSDNASLCGGKHESSLSHGLYATEPLSISVASIELNSLFKQFIYSLYLKGVKGFPVI